MRKKCEMFLNCIARLKVRTLRPFNMWCCIYIICIAIVLLLHCNYNILLTMSVLTKFSPDLTCFVSYKSTDQEAAVFIKRKYFSMRVKANYEIKDRL